MAAVVLVRVSRFALFDSTWHSRKRWTQPEHLATGLYVTSDDFLADDPQVDGHHRLAPAADSRRAGHPGGAAGVADSPPRPRFLRYANTHLRGYLPYLPTQSVTTRGSAAIGTLRAVIAHLVARTSSVSDDVWSWLDSLSCRACGRAAKFSDLAARPVAQASSLASALLRAARVCVCALSGLAGVARLSPPRRRSKYTACIDADRSGRCQSEVDRENNCYGKAFEGALADAENRALRGPPQRRETTPGPPVLGKPFRRVIESINNR